VRTFLIALLVVAGVGCSEAASVTARGDSSPTPEAQSPAPSAAPSPEPSIEARRAAGKAPRFAAKLIEAERRFKNDLGAWRSSGLAATSPEFRKLTLLGLEIQKMYRVLVVKEELSRKVARRLTGRLQWKLQANLKASRTLRALSGSPLKPPIELKTKKPAPPGRLLKFYAEGERRFGIPAHVLASVNFIESKYGRLNGPSSAGAMGPMQFMPATWDAYGRGDIMDPHDSIIAAARYLSASGGPERMRDALFAYNRSTAYVDAIQIYARQIKADSRNFYGYYLYQVFVRTTEGDLQITGPGSSRS
jgi:soluble lytic murein transglycosylase-like protein